MKRFVVCLLVLFLFSFAVYSEGQQEGGNDAKLLEWEKAAGLGEFRPTEDNWAEIEAKAKEEGELIIWSNTSRVFRLSKGFYNKYKIKAQPNDIGTGSLFEKLRREQAAGIFSPDVVLCSGIAELYNDFVPHKALYKFVPQEIEKVLVPLAKGQDLAVQRFGGKVVGWNTEANKKCPIDSWWDFTRPEWKGKIIMKDPMLGGSDLYLMVTFVNEAEKMAEAYKAEFGEDIVLNGTEDAGFEFLKRFLKNELILMKGGSPVAEAVGAHGQDHPPLGIMSASKSRLREEAGLAIAVAWDLKPFSMFLTSSTISIAKFAKNPNAAKLMIQYAYGDKNMEGGFAPFNTTGTWSARSDVKDTVNEVQINDIAVWNEDATKMYDNTVYVRDFWIQNM